jgi:hypothetical protein
MDKRDFNLIVNMIRDDPVFRGTARMTNIETQVQVALCRLGTYGNAASKGMVARKFGMSEGTVTNCTNRVITAVCKLSRAALSWPDV